MAYPNPSMVKKRPPVTYAPPNLGAANRSFGTARNPVTFGKLGIAASVPGVRTRDIGGAPITANQERINPFVNNTDPLQAFQQNLRKRIQETEQFTNSVVATSNRRRQAFRAPAQTRTSRNVQQRRPTRQQAYQVSNRRSPGGWGGYQNGRIPAEAMARVSFSPGHVLESNAARALDALNAEYRRVFGTNISITDSYRSLQGQINVKRSKGRMAATPGTSVHGWGKALDLGGGINRAGTRQHQWMQANAPRYGFVNPPWAKTVKFEPWHWEFQG